jgi:hypothetical protein
LARIALFHVERRLASDRRIAHGFFGAPPFVYILGRAVGR